jgi:hypothetical protein
MPATVPLTPEQVRNSYEFKVIKRMLKDEYDFVLDVDFNDDKLNEYNLIFLDLTIDPFKLAEYFDAEPYHGLFHALMYTDQFSSPFLRTLLTGAREGISTEFDNETKDLIDGIRDSKAIPRDKKLPEQRAFRVGSYTVNPNISIPQDYKQELIHRYPYLADKLNDRWGG